MRGEQIASRSHADAERTLPGLTLIWTCTESIADVAWRRKKPDLRQKCEGERAGEGPDRGALGEANWNTRLEHARIACRFLVGPVGPTHPW